MANSDWVFTSLALAEATAAQAQYVEDPPEQVGLKHEWPFVVTARDDYGVERDSGFNSLAVACDFAHYMDQRPLEVGSRDVVLFVREQGKRFIPVGGGFHSYKPVSMRKQAGA